MQTATATATAKETVTAAAGPVAVGAAGLYGKPADPASLVRVIAQNESICVGLFEPPGARSPADWLVVVLERYDLSGPWALTLGADAHRAMRLATRLSEAAGVIARMAG